LVGVDGGSCGGELVDKRAVKLVAGEAKGGLGKAPAGKNGGSTGENDIGRFNGTELIETGAKA
jgi:hypothetical protein